MLNYFHDSTSAVRSGTDSCKSSFVVKFRLCVGTNRVLLTCLEKIADTKSGAPTTASVVIDGESWSADIEAYCIQKLP